MSDAEILVTSGGRELTGLQTFDFLARNGISIEVEAAGLATGRGKKVVVRIGSTTGVWAMGRLTVGRGPVNVDLIRRKGAVSLIVRSSTMRWAGRLIPIDDRVVQVVERARGDGVSWQWFFPGSVVHTHKQLAVITMPAAGARFRMGGFSQYGQLFDLKDWAVVADGEQCAGLVGVRVGKWSHPTIGCGKASGTEDGLTLDMGWSAGSSSSPITVRRSYVLVQAQTQKVITPHRLGIDYFEPPAGHAAWGAGMVARYGSSRPERLAAVERLANSVAWERPEKFLFGDAKILERALQRGRDDARLRESEPLWANDFESAKQNLLKELERFHTALIDGAFLHPLVNPVAIRPVAPASVLFHILDFLGHLTDAERSRAAYLLSNIAEFVLRADFYPHNYATKEPEFPYGPRSLYRGMLNQNFNTDGYMLVGLAGCVLTQHPRAALWRRHAVEQFNHQMGAYVWPGGAWEESHTYANHVKASLLPFVFAMRYMPEKLDLMQDSRFRAMCRFFALLLSPPDAVIDGLRGIPAIGDHGYQHHSYTYLFGWLASACDAPNDPDHALYLWAWHVTGAEGGKLSESTRLLNPLLLPDPPVAPPAPQLPQFSNLPGYGAAYRGGQFDSDSETLLVVRCGQSWGHYHFDQGSFWWWAFGRLICCDADLGGGELKFAHRGHNVLGYPGRDPLQHLDRQNFHIDQCDARPGGGMNVRCQIPVASWGPTNATEKKIPLDQQPHVTRRFEYDGQYRLRITDEPAKSPDGLVLWSLHAPAKSASLVGSRQVVFDLDGAGRTLRVDLPMEPKSVEIQQFGQTTALFCTYESQSLVHELYVS